MISALKEHLPGGMDEKEADAWLQAYSFIADMMIEELPEEGLEYKDAMVYLSIRRVSLSTEEKTSSL